MSTQPTQAQLQADAVAQIANVSIQLRNAISAAIPTAPEQYLSVSVPGTVIDVRSQEHGGSLVYNNTATPFVPAAVQQVEARLVDNMVPLAKVMVGNTGKSVARSYSRALDTLVPRKATVTNGEGQIRSPGEASYDTAMAYLTKPDPGSGMTPVDIYIEKQKLWAAAQTEWDEAKISARKTAETDPENKGDPVLVLQAYNDWSQANYRKYKFAVQGAWMDWVANGHKYDVEFAFGTVDIDSIMARIENSKESMRNSTMVDADGANELQAVSLTPPNWATLCKQKAEGWFTRNGQYTIEQIDAEIQRLNRLLSSYTAMSALATASPSTFPTDAGTGTHVSAVTAPDATTGGDGTVSTAYTSLYTAYAIMNKYKSNLRAAKDDTARTAITNSEDYKTAVTALATAQTTLNKTIDANTAYHTALNKYNLATLSEDAQASTKTWIDGQIAKIQSELTDLRTKRQNKLAAQPHTVPIIVNANTGGDNSIDLAAPDDVNVNPMFADSPSTSVLETDSTSDPWTTITCSFSASAQSQKADTSSWGASFGGGAGWGLWSVGGSYSHDQSSSNSVADLSTCDVNVTFSALVVNIDRPWLYAELFNDFELDVANDVFLSPGAQNLHTMMDLQGNTGADGKPTNDALNAQAYLAQYNSFPAFPTSFIVAADTSIEFEGDTSHVEDHFSSQANSGSVSFGWGPFSVQSSFHQASSQQSHQMQTTATGVRLTFGAPQIIGWVSQIVPQMPRDPAYEPMIQNLRPALKPTPPPS